MTELVPDNSNRIAHAIGLIFHPALVSIPTLLLVLNDLPLIDITAWTVLVSMIVLGPGMMLVLWLQRRDQHTYQRQTRLPIYALTWASVLACLGIIIVLNAPRELIASIATLAVWLPLQLAINSAFTKISTHVAVITGCLLGVLVLGKIEPLALQIAALVTIPLVAWARIVTKNHTLTQVVLGFVVAAGCVLTVMPFVLSL